MPTRSFDVIVVGLGAMGSAAAYQLAKSGQSILGLDQFTPPHTLGSSHGQTRIIREAYFEHPAYVPLVQRAYELWAELESVGKARLFRRTGGLMIGPRDGMVVGGAQRSAQEHGLAHETLTAGQLQERFPVFRPSDDMGAVWEPRAGILFPEECIQTHLRLAKDHGAALHLDEAVLEWSSSGQGVEVRTQTGRYLGGQLLLTAGAWVIELVPDLNLPLRIERQVLYWFDPRCAPGLFEPDRCPIYIFEFEPGRFFYGFPNLGNGIKVARHHEGEDTHPSQLDRAVHVREEEEMRAVLRRFLPDAEGALCSAVVCMYTDTPDGHFLIDRHPGFPQVLLASPCSGHGFKFASAIGEVLADLLVKGQSRFDLGLFELGRLLPSSPERLDI